MKVNLWYFDEPYTNLRLGGLVTIWTTHISSTVSSVALDALQTQPATILTSIFPERDAGCYIQIHQPDDQRHLHRLPLNYGHSRGIEGLLPLRNFVEGAGAEIDKAKILVYVKAVGRPASCPHLNTHDRRQLTSCRYLSQCQIQWPKNCHQCRAR